MRRHLLGTSNRNVLEEYFNEQSGHGDDVAVNYAVSFDTIRSVSEEHLARFVEVSKRQHEFLMPHLAPVAPTQHVSTASAVGGTSVGIPHLDYQQLARTLAPIVAPQLATLLKSGMEQNIAEAFAAITPIHQHPSSSSLPHHHPKVSNTPESRLGMHIVDADQVEIPPDRYIELRALMGKDASFLSMEQACAVELAAQRQHDLLVVLGTSGGKSLVFMAAAINKAETQVGLATVVILPLVALLDDMAIRLRKKGVHSMRWKSGVTSHYNARIILVSADVAATEQFLSYFLLGCRTKKIGRAVLDEVHFLITTTHFRPLLRLIKNLRAGDVPFILMTATLPPAATERLLEEVHFIPASTRLIRAPTHRPEIVYAHFQLTGKSSDQYIEYLSGHGEKKNMVKYILDILMASNPEARALVFCLTVTDANFVAQALRCQSHHAKLSEGERKSILEGWKGGKHRVLATTSALAAGLDYPNVVLVAHYGKPRNIIDYAQESGRGGRMLPRAYSTVFSDPARPDLPLDAGQNNIGVEDMTTWTTTDQCRRLILGGSLDGIPKTCLSLVTVALCDLCELKVPANERAPSRVLASIRNALQSNEQSSELVTTGEGKEAPILVPPPQTPLMNLPTSSSNNFHHSVTRFTSPLGNDDMSSNNSSPPDCEPLPNTGSLTAVTPQANPLAAGPSMPVQIAAARARNENNRVMINSFSHDETKTRLSLVKDLLGQQNFCGPCWIQGFDRKHDAVSCQSVACGWESKGSPYKSWRSKLQIPKYHCFTCFLPQIHDLHDNVTRNHRCELGDFSGRILYALWNLANWKGQLREAFALTGINNDSDFGRWLTRVSEDEKFLYIHHVILWVYQKMQVLYSI